MKHVKHGKKLISLLLSAAVAMSMTLSTVMTPLAASSSVSDLRQKLQELQSEQEKVNQQLKDAQSNKADAEALKTQLEQQKALILSQISNLSEQIGSLDEEIVNKQDEIDQKQQEVDQKQAEYDQRWADFKDRMRAMQRLNDGGSIALLSSATNLYQLLTFATTLDQIVNKDEDTCQQLENEHAELEQQRAEQIAALTHDLKTPLSIIQGNADLLAEDALSADQQTQVEAILRGTDRAQQYLAALRTACAPSAAGETFSSHILVSTLAETARALCAPAGVQFVLDEQWQGTLCAAQRDLLRAAENLLDNAVRYTPRGGTVTLLVTKEKQDFILRVTDTGPGFTAEALARAGELLYTEAARSDTAHQGFGLYFARRVALSHSGTLRLSNTPGGCAELRLPICEQIEK